MQSSTALIILPDHLESSEDSLDEDNSLVDRIRIVNEVLLTKNITLPAKQVRAMSHSAKPFISIRCIGIIYPCPSYRQSCGDEKAPNYQGGLFKANNILYFQPRQAINQGSSDGCINQHPNATDHYGKSFVLAKLSMPNHSATPVGNSGTYALAVKLYKHVKATESPRRAFSLPLSSSIIPRKCQMPEVTPR
jgi:hypothetical protein